MNYSKTLTFIYNEIRDYPFFKNYKVYHIEDTKDRIESRLKERLTEGELMGSRLKDYEKEVTLGRKLADRIFINTDMETLFEEIKQCLLEDFKTK